MRPLPHRSGEGPLRLRLAAGPVLGIFVLAAGGLYAQQPANACLECHAELEEPHLSEPAVAFAGDAHHQAGISCAGCHGGEALADDERIGHAGMRASRPRADIPGMCGRCHSDPEFMKRYDPDIRVDQVETYYTSRHGTLLRQGDTNVAVCVDCHSSHGVLPPSDQMARTHPLNLPDMCASCHSDEDLMRPYGIPTDQKAEWERSVHHAALDGGDLSAPVCNDCHGNHGAVPPGYASVGRVCGECHFQMGQYFAMSAHDSAFARLDRPGCATCHGNHDIQPADDELLGLDEAATCRGSGCHSESDRGGQAARTMLVWIDSLHRVRTRADSILREAEHAGMPVFQPQFELTRVQNALVSARAVIHTALLDSVRVHIDLGLEAARGAYDDGVGAFEELRVRRTGLAASSAVILLLIVLLLIRIRALGHGVPRAAGSDLSEKAGSDLSEKETG